MRMRKKKNSEARLSACSALILDGRDEPMKNPAEEVFGLKGAPVWLEIGAGKGGFACGMVNGNPDVAYFAMEKITDCVIIAAEKARDNCSEGAHLRFITDTADNLTYIFAPESVDAIFLNFSDPWSKKGYAKRRLTHQRYLSVYLSILKEGGKIRFKTDNVGLFDFTLEQISQMGLEVCALTRDLHNSPYNEGNVRTEYEENFSSQGININMLELTKPLGYVAEIPPELSLERTQYKNIGLRGEDYGR